MFQLGNCRNNPGCTLQEIQAKCGSNGCNAILFTANHVPYVSILKDGVLLGVVKIISED